MDLEVLEDLHFLPAGVLSKFVTLKNSEDR